MAGVRTKPGASGKFQGWFTQYSGRRKFFWGTHNRQETLRIARRLEDEHRQVTLGYRPAPKDSERAKRKPVDEVMDAYLLWGKAQGGRGGQPWSAVHFRMKRKFIAFWKDRLDLRTMADFDGILDKVENTIGDLMGKGLTPKTAWDHADGLQSFCNWCARRGLLEDNPLKRLQKIDTSPRTCRRAMTGEEIRRLLESSPPHRRLLYETAFVSGLRAGELRALEVQHLDVRRGGVHLDARWTKNRKPGFQPLPRALVTRLGEFAAKGEAKRFYAKAHRRSDGKPPEEPILYVPSHPARSMDEDLKAAGIPKWTPEGKVDFHAARSAYVTAVVESGANAKEAQVLARHATPAITMNVYARTRPERLAEVAERVGKTVLPDPERAISVLSKAVGAEYETGNPARSARLPVLHDGGGGGNRTRVRKRFREGVYVRGLIVYVSSFPVSDRQDTRRTEP